MTVLRSSEPNHHPVAFMTDIRISTITATTNGNKVSAGFDLILVQD